MSYMSKKMIEVLNNEKELYGNLKTIIESGYSISQKVASILAKCKDFEYRNKNEV